MNDSRSQPLVKPGGALDCALGCLLILAGAAVILALLWFIVANRDGRPTMARERRRALVGRAWTCP